MTLPTLTDPAQVQSLLADERYAVSFAQAYIALCIAAYQTVPALIQNIPKVIAALPGLLGSHWECSWGPATDADGSNLALVATALRNGDNAPLFQVVVIRGTDKIDKHLKGNILGDIEQLFEDLRVMSQKSLPWLPPSAHIAEGTAVGLDVIQNLRWPQTLPNRTLEHYLANSQIGPVQDRPPIIVTGHSLGGCLTSVVAPWLAHMLPGARVHATSFAGPSAGNQPFVAYLASVIPTFRRYYNIFDVIPNWWATLGANNSIYSAYGRNTPDLMIVADWLFNKLDPRYAQPLTGMPLSGKFKDGLDWRGEAALQHHPQTYQRLLA